eukprot:3693037-Pleurochrysis_carterae.AAC.1
MRGCAPPASVLRARSFSYIHTSNIHERLTACSMLACCAAVACAPLLHSALTSTCNACDAKIAW